jgi:uncharacterized repeat protein (TIGR03803 family)
MRSILHGFSWLAVLVAAGILPARAAAQAPPLQVLHTFTPSPSRPNGALLQVPDGSFYGVTMNGIIRLSTSGQVTEVARLEVGTPTGALVRASDGALYGTTSDWGPAARDTVFRVDPATGAYRTLHVFDSLSEGRRPLGGLVEVGGSLYGVTAEGPGLNQKGTIFHVVVATGTVVTDHAFGLPSALPANPAGPLVLASDGRLYGVCLYGGSGTLYRFDPVSRSVTAVHQFSGTEGWARGSLTVGPDGRLYGNAGGGTELAGTVFRYAPASDQFDVVYTLRPSNGVDGRNPGPLLAAVDGHFYGVSAANNGSGPGTLFRLRAGAGGTFTYEPLRALEYAVAGWPGAPLTQGADGLIYGTSVGGGPTDTGTLFRFDPLASGPPGNAIAFTVLHAFPFLTTWGPSAPVLGADGFLYGLTSHGGANNRGMVYRLAPDTGAVTTLGALPGAWSRSTSNSPLVAGPDGFLYGTSTAHVPAKVHQIIRVHPASGAAAVAAAAIGPAPPPPPNEFLVGVVPGLVRTPAGHLYGVRYDTTATFVYRFDPVANTVADVASTGPMNFGTMNFGTSPLLATSNGQVLLVANFGTGPDMRSLLFRVNPAAALGFDRVTLSSAVTWLGGLTEGADGRIYLAGTAMGEMARVRRLDLTTGQLTSACTLDGEGYVKSSTFGADGALHGFVAGDTFQRLFRCDPITGVSSLAMLPTGVGRGVDALAPVGSLMYGASFGSAGYEAEQHPGGALFRFAAGGTLPALDTDADTLPSAWETAYGLDPFDAGHGSGPADDPDGDGRTNAQELAEGTHPRGFVTRLFAEGASNAFFRTTFDLVNSRSGPGAIVRARILTDSGATIATDLVMPPRRHRAIDPATLPGVPQGAYSAIFESDEPIVVDRTMTWDASGYGSHIETGIAAPSATWYFAEGSTSGDFSLFYLLQNPQTTAVTATVRYLRPFGQAPIDKTYTLPPASRTTIVVDAQGSELASTDVSAVITATAPIVAERAMYVNRPGQPFAAGHESAGVTAPALDWFLAEGATGVFFDLFVLIANPSSTAATVEVEYLRASGPPLTRSYVVPAQSRMTIWVDDEQLPAGSGEKPLAEGSVSTSVHVTNGVPVIVERAMWWPGPAAASNFWYEAHNSPGATGSATRWIIAGAELGGTDDADTFVLIANLADRAGSAFLRLFGDGIETGLPNDAYLPLPPKSRTTVNLRTWFGLLSPGRYAVMVETKDLDPLPLVVERATYASPGGVFWGRGGNALASPVP